MASKRQKHKSKKETMRGKRRGADATGNSAKQKKEATWRKCTEYGAKLQCNHSELSLTQKETANSKMRKEGPGCKNVQHEGAMSHQRRRRTDNKQAQKDEQAGSEAQRTA